MNVPQNNSGQQTEGLVLDKASRCIDLFLSLSKAFGVLLLIFLGYSLLFHHQKTVVFFERYGWAIKNINLSFIEVQQINTYDLADKLTEIQIATEEAEKNIEGSSKISEVEKNDFAKILAEAKSKTLAAKDLVEREFALIKQAKADNGMKSSPIPDVAWIQVGFVNSSGKFFVFPRIDDKRTRISGNKIDKLFIKYDANVVGNGADCVTTKLEDFKPLPPDSMLLTIKADSKNPVELHVIGTEACKSVGDTNVLTAKIEIPKDRVIFVRHADLK